MSGPLNWFEEEAEEDQLPRSDYITYGCWVRVIEEKNNREIIYHIPLKDDHSRAWYGIEEKMMGQDVGFRVFLAGKNYSVLDFGRDDEREDTRAEFKSREEVSTPPKESPALVEPELDGNTKPLVPDTINFELSRALKTSPNYLLGIEDNGEMIEIAFMLSAIKNENIRLSLVNHIKLLSTL